MQTIWHNACTLFQTRSSPVTPVFHTGCIYHLTILTSHLLSQARLPLPLMCYSDSSYLNSLPPIHFPHFMVNIEAKVNLLKCKLDYKRTQSPSGASHTTYRVLLIWALAISASSTPFLLSLFQLLCLLCHSSRWVSSCLSLLAGNVPSSWKNFSSDSLLGILPHFFWVFAFCLNMTLPISFPTSHILWCIYLFHINSNNRCSINI